MPGVYAAGDVTGVDAIMEVLTFAGVPSVVFTEAPPMTRLAWFVGC